MESFSKLTRDAPLRRSQPPLAAMDFHDENFRDLCWLLTQKENARFCPDPPRMPSDDHYEKQLKAGNSDVDATSSEVKPAPYAPNGPHACSTSTRQECWPNDPRGREAARHPSSLVPDTGLQRCMDGLLHRNRTYATSVLMSNRVVCTPPFRLYNDTLQANVGALTQHCMLVAESICACADVPGIRNQQEAFSGHGKAPENTVRCEDDEVAPDAHSTHQSPQSTFASESGGPAPAPAPRRFGTGAGDARGAGAGPGACCGGSGGGAGGDGGSSVGDKRKASDAADDAEALGKETAAAAAAAAANGDPTTVSKLPFSYDIVSINLARRMAAMLYDDEGEAEAAQAHRSFTATIKTFQSSRTTSCRTFRCPSRGTARATGKRSRSASGRSRR